MSLLSSEAFADAMRCRWRADSDGGVSDESWAWPWVRILVESLRNIGNIPPYCCLPSATTVPVSFRGDTTQQCPSQDLHFFFSKKGVIENLKELFAKGRSYP